MADAPPIAQILLKAFLFLLGSAGVLMVISAAVSGIFMLFVSGDARLFEKAKKSLIYSIIGAIVILGAYVIIRFLGQALGGKL